MSMWCNSYARSRAFLQHGLKIGSLFSLNSLDRYKCCFSDEKADWKEHHWDTVYANVQDLYLKFLFTLRVKEQQIFRKTEWLKLKNRPVCKLGPAP